MRSNTFVVTSLPRQFSNDYLVYQDSHISVYSTVHSSFNAKFTRGKNGLRIWIGDAVNADQGLTISHNKEKSEVTATSDKLGTEIVFYKIVGHGFVLSNRLDALTSYSKQYDSASLYQFFVSGYNVGSSTILDGVKQSCASEELCFRLKGKQWSVTSKTFGWSYDKSEYDVLEKLVMSSSASIDNTTLMTSAGWDTRTLLCNINPRSILAYTHGDLSSREIQIARDLTAELRIDHLLADTRNNCVSNELLDQMLDELGFALFPLWYVGCKRLQSISENPISSGVFGEFLGGHWGVDKLLGTRSRASSLLKFIVPSYKSSITFKALFDALQPSRDLWYLSKEAKAVLFDETELLLERNKKEMLSYGLADVELAVEQFMAKHKGRQYLLKQPQCAKSSVGYTTPLASEALIEAVMGICYSNRVHNKLNRRVLKSQGAELLRHPMAATLCAANRPIVVQELSRAFRLGIEKSTGKTNYGWFNYDFLLESTLFDDAIDSLTSNIWDKAAMRSVIVHLKKQGEVTQLGYTLDTLCKVKTVDYIGQNESGESQLISL